MTQEDPYIPTPALEMKHLATSYIDQRESVGNRKLRIITGLPARTRELCQKSQFHLMYYDDDDSSNLVQCCDVLKEEYQATLVIIY